MADTSNLTNFLTDVADAIRTKKEITKEIPAEEFDTEILSIKSSGDVKLFTSKTEMQADASATLGDLAIIYYSDIQNGTAQTEFSTINFSDVVVLPSAVTSSFYCMMRSVTGAGGDGQIQLNASQFRFEYYGTSNMIQVRYTSTDGITYTKTSGDSIVTFEEPIKCYYEEEWNDMFGYFMKVGGTYFEGLYECTDESSSGNKYTIASTQLSLNSSGQLLPNIIGYGKNGIITGDGSIWDAIPKDVILNIFNTEDMKYNKFQYVGMPSDNMPYNKLYNLGITDEYTQKIVWIGDTINQSDDCITTSGVGTMRRFKPYIDDDTYRYFLCTSSTTSVYCLRMNKATYACDFHTFTVPMSWHRQIVGGENGSGYTVKDGKIYTGGYNAADDNYRVAIYELDPNTDTVKDISHTALSATYKEGGGTYFRKNGSNIECFFCYKDTNSEYRIDKFVYDGTSTARSSTTSTNYTPTCSISYTTQKEKYVAYQYNGYFSVLDMDTSIIYNYNVKTSWLRFFETEKYIGVHNTMHDEPSWWVFDKTLKTFSQVTREYVSPNNNLFFGDSLDKQYYYEQSTHTMYKINFDDDTKVIMGYCHTIEPMPFYVKSDSGNEKQVQYDVNYLFDLSKDGKALKFEYISVGTFAGVYTSSTANVNFDKVNPLKSADFILCYTNAEKYVLKTT